MTPAKPIADGRYLVEPSGFRKVTLRIVALPGSNYRVVKQLTSDGKEWFPIGFLMPNGDIQPDSNIHELGQAALKALASDPDPNLLALRFAAETGACFVCGRPLQDQVSVAQGIGPDCAARLNIPRISEQTAAERIERRRQAAAA